MHKSVYFKIIFVIWAVVLVFLGKGVWSIYGKERLAKADRLDAERQVASLKDRENFLLSEVNKLKTESGIELEIREKFNVKKPGEEVVVIIDATTTDATEIIDQSFSGRFIKWFRDIFE